MNESRRVQDAHDAQAHRRMSSRIANRRAFNPDRRRLPETLTHDPINQNETVDEIMTEASAAVVVSNDVHHDASTSHSTINSTANHDRFQDENPFILQSALASIENDPLFMMARHPYTESFTTNFCGEMDVVCSSCGAFHWLAEETSRTSPSHPVFSLCCGKGKVQVSLLENPPRVLRDLLESRTLLAKDFRKNIVLYNRALAFTSLGVKEDYSINDGRGPPVFRIHGELKHWSGSLIAPESRSPTYAQLYIFDPEIALRYRSNNNPKLRRDTLSTLEDIIRKYNPYSDMYLSAHQILQNVHAPDLSLRLTPLSNNRHPNNISANEVAVIVPDSNTYQGDHRDILLTLHPGNDNPNIHRPTNLGLQRISEGHPAYCPLHYVLLFPHGEPGWNWDSRLTTGKRMSLREHTAFRLHDRQGEFSTILHSGRLLQHYMVDMFAAIDQGRLRYLSQHQSQLRLSHLQGVEDAVNHRDDVRDLHQVGQRTILPSSYNGGPRDLYQRYQDSMAISRHFKKMDLFLTITANPNWPEIRHELLPGENPEDRPDLIARVFKLKRDALMETITKRGIFGLCVAHIDSIEFQRRGLPHDHILISLARQFQLNSPEVVDECIWARWPDPHTQPLLFEMVKKYMLHGPCGNFNRSAPCMENGRCRFGFPKEYQERTILTNDGYPLYYRPNDGIAYEVNGFPYDNRWISTYNPFVLIFMNGHANLECVFSFWSNKYLFKYLKKGGDFGSIELADQNDEIKRYIEGRYFSAGESAWRIFEFGLHHQFPSVIRLPVHLPDDQSFAFDPNDDSQIVLRRGRHVQTALTAFFDANADDAPFKTEARKYTYQEFPIHFALKKKDDERWWQLRQQQPALGRMVAVTSTGGERFYLRVLLGIAHGPKSFEDLRRLPENGHLCETFYDTCVQRGLLENDGEWEICLKEACDFKTGSVLRHLFATLLLFSEPRYPHRLLGFESTFSFILGFLSLSI